MALERQFVIYGVTLVVVGVCWINHHIQFRRIERTNRTLTSINLAYLMIVSFLPFATDLIGDHEKLLLATASLAHVVLLGALHVLPGRIDDRIARDGYAQPGAAQQP